MCWIYVPYRRRNAANDLVLFGAEQSTGFLHMSGMFTLIESYERFRPLGWVWFLEVIDA